MCNMELEVTSLTTTTSDEPTDEELRAQVSREVDNIGAYQLTTYLILGLPFVLAGSYSVGYVFTSSEVDYRCLVPECENATSAQWRPPWIDAAIPSAGGKIESCTRYVALGNISNSGTCTAASFNRTLQSCGAWVYDSSEQTILNEWDITCNKNRWMLALVGTVHSVGELFGLIFAGYFSDRFGRRTALSIQTFVTGIMGLIQSFSVNYWMFIAFEFLEAAASVGMCISGFTLGMEMLTDNRRTMGCAFMVFTNAFGEILAGLAAMWLRSWRAILQFLFAPGLFAIFLPLVIPESIRWLIVNGKTSDVENIYKKMAKMNGFEISKAKLRIYKELNFRDAVKEKTKGKSESRVSTRQALSSPILFIRLLACGFCWLTNTFVFYGLSLNAVTIAGDKYVNFILVCLIEIPAGFLVYFINIYFGRKITSCLCYVISGILCLAILLVPADTTTYWPLIFFLGGKCFITIAFTILYMSAAELFPTTARNSLMAICSIMGRVGSILAPQTRLLSTVMESLPMVLFGCMGIAAGIVSLILPETRGLHLPDTIAEAENIGKANSQKPSTVCEKVQ